MKSAPYFFCGEPPPSWMPVYGSRSQWWGQDKIASGIASGALMERV